MELVEKVMNLILDLDANNYIQNEEGYWTGDMYNMGGGACEYVLQKPAIYEPDIEKRKKAKEILQKLYPELCQTHNQLQQNSLRLQKTYSSYKWYQFSKKRVAREEIESAKRELMRVRGYLEIVEKTLDQKMAREH